MPLRGKKKEARRRSVAFRLQAYPHAVVQGGAAIAARNPMASRAQEVAQLRKTLGLTQERFGRLTGSSTRKIAALESDESKITPKLDRKLTEVERLKEGLQHVIPQHAIAKWLDTPNQAFGDLKPIELIERGHADRIWRMIYELESGQPG